MVIRQRFWSKCFSWIVTIAIWGIVGFGLFCLWFGYDLPDTDRLANSQRKASVALLAKDGSLLATYGDLHGSFIEAKSLPQHVRNALLATEDRRFFNHFGVDLLGVVRAAWINYRSGRVVQGGSTLTQQLAKNLLMTDGLYSHQDRSFRRKIQEVLLAFLLEFRFSKEQILTIYLNRVYFGAGVYGIGAASQKYFHKFPGKLTLLESAVLAGLLKAPSKYSPTHDVELAEKRARVVLSAMESSGFITQDQRVHALSDLSSLARSHEKATTGRYFSDWVLDEITKIIGDLEEDLIVKTTLDPSLQKTAEDMLQAIVLMEGQGYGVHQGAFVSMTPKGAVRALVGGVEYGASPFNRATQAKRQTGSIFKTFVFLGAFEQGHLPHDQISDAPMRIGKWSPKNYKWQSRGSVSIEEGLAYSLNTVTVRLAAQQGWKHLHEIAQKVGIVTPLAKDLTISLGSGEATLLEMTGAYAIFANGGFFTKPYGVLEIKNTQGNVLYTHENTLGTRVISHRSWQAMLKCLQSVLSYGTGKRNKLSRPCAGKSGTSQSHRDAWFIGFTPDLVTGVWFGNDNGAAMKDLTGGKLPGRLWHDFMEDVHKNVPPRFF